MGTPRERKPESPEDSVQGPPGAGAPSPGPHQSTWLLLLRDLASVRGTCWLDCPGSTVPSDLHQPRDQWPQHPRRPHNIHAACASV